MKKVYSHKFIIYLCIFGCLLFSTFAIVSVCLAITNFYNRQINAAIFFSFCPLVSVFADALYIFLLNRMGYKVIYDDKNKIVYREGFICGYKYKVNINDIQEIIVAEFFREATFYVFVTSTNNKKNYKNYYGGYRSSYIRLEKTKKNYEFIKQFWDKPIKEYKNIDDLLNNTDK